MRKHISVLSILFSSTAGVWIVMRSDAVADVGKFVMKDAKVARLHQPCLAARKSSF